jgi:O-acetyl-ADP-ribose deacetylase (regulator of RNase III)
MPMTIVRNDITTMTVDAIVNAANAGLRMGGGVCGAIFNAAGPDKLQAACDRYGQCAPGQAVITEGFALPARFVIHTVGPIWAGGAAGEEQTLRDCYTNSLNLAIQRQLTSIAFPLISSGIFGYPVDQALQVALAAITAFLLEHDMDVYLVVFDKRSFRLSRQLYAEVKSYIDETLVDTYTAASYHRRLSDEKKLYRTIIQKPATQELHTDLCVQERSLEEVVSQLEDSFSQMVFRFITQKGLSEVETYRKANIDRKLFSKIRSDRDYNPRKSTAIALAIALELSVDETKDLLARAGYTLSHSHMSDVIIEYFISNKLFNVYEINEALFAFDQPLLGV